MSRPLLSLLASSLLAPVLPGCPPVAPLPVVTIAPESPTVTPPRRLLAAPAPPAPERALQDGAEALFPQFVRLIPGDRRVAWTADELTPPPEGREPDRPGSEYDREVRLVESTPAAVRLLLEDSRLRVLAWFRRSGLRPVVVRTVTLSAVPAAAAQGGLGVTLAPGWLVTSGASQAGFRQVKGATDEVVFEGWLPQDALGERFVPGPTLDGREVNGRVAPGTVVHDEQGRALGRFEVGPGSQRSYPEIDVKRLEGAPPGSVRVWWAGERVTLRGDVPASAFRAVAPGSLSESSGGPFEGGGFMFHATPRPVRPGAWIHRAEGGDRIGVARQALVAMVQLGESCGPQWCSVQVHLPSIGFASVAIRTDDLPPAP